MEELSFTIFEKIVLPIIFAIVSYIVANLKNRNENKKQDINNLSLALKGIIETLERDKYSKPLLNFECNQVIGDIRTFCDKYNVSEVMINNLLLDLKLYATNDNPDVNEVSKIASSILSAIQRRK